MKWWWGRAEAWESSFPFEMYGMYHTISWHVISIESIVFTERELNGTKEIVKLRSRDGLRQRNRLGSDRFDYRKLSEMVESKKGKHQSIALCKKAVTPK